MMHFLFFPLSVVVNTVCISIHTFCCERIYGLYTLFGRGVLVNENVLAELLLLRPAGTCKTYNLPL